MILRPSGIGFDYRRDMRRIGWIISLLALSATGCASHAPPVAAVQQPHLYSADNASALAFDPPVLTGMPRMDLSRDGREPSAFAGFQEASTSYYYLQTYDFYSTFAFGGGRRGGNPDYYNRQAITSTYGISTH